MKYKFFILRRHIILLCFLGVFLSVLNSCQESKILYQVELAQSIDFAKTKEAGTSQIYYDDRTGINEIVYSDAWLWSAFGGSGKNDINDISDIKHIGDFKTGAYLLNPDAEETDEKNIGIRGGIEYISKGAKFKTGGGSFGLNYLEVPIIPEYRFSAGTGNICVGLGPYFAYGIGGKGDGESSFGDNNGGYKRFDAGLSFLLGYKFDAGVAFSLSYDLGLANNIYPDQDVKSHNRCFSINLGYQIGKLFVKKQK